jgi:hypothetical protein
VEEYTVLMSAELFRPTQQGDDGPEDPETMSEKNNRKRRKRKQNNRQAMAMGPRGEAASTVRVTGNEFEKDFDPWMYSNCEEFFFNRLKVWSRVQLVLV